MAGIGVSKVIWKIVVYFTILQYFTSASYLDFPRLNFAGNFRADVSTINNDICSYKLTKNLCKSWNPNGTGEFHFFNTTITSAVYENGTLTESDPIVNYSLVSNLLQPPAKLVDVDQEAQTKSTIYGLKLSIVSDTEALPPKPILEADWIRSIIAYDIWVRLLCSTPSREPGVQDQFFSAQGTSKLKNVTWGDMNGSVVLEQLQRASKMGLLSVRITHYQFSAAAKFRSGDFTFGTVVGTIGISKPEEPLNAGGQRLLSYKEVPSPNLTVPKTDSCYPNISNNEHIYWTYKAPFMIQEVENSSYLSVDLSNALAMDKYGNIRDLGKLQFAVYAEISCCMHLLGAEIDYLENGWLKRTGGIVDINLHDKQLQRLNKTHLLLVRVLPMDSTGPNDDTYEVCEYLPSQKNLAESVQVLLKEIRYFIRPMGYIVFRLQRTYNEIATVDLLVTDFGVPAYNLSVNLNVSGKPLPLKGIIQNHNTVKTNETGIATFVLQVNNETEKRIPYPRQSKQNCSCNRPESFTSFNIDGQLYHYIYNVIGTNDTELCSNQADMVKNSIQFVFCTNYVTVLTHSDPYEFNYTEPYTWVSHVQPIFEQYYRLYPVMSNILNMSNYSNVVLPHNINLLRYAMSRDFDDPTYMPVIRDLSPLKQQVVLRWLDNPLYNAEGGNSTEIKPTCIPQSNTILLSDTTLCPASTDNNIIIPFEFSSSPSDPSYAMYYDTLMPPEVNSNQNAQPSQQCQWQFDAISNNCTIETLKQHAQQGVQLEFATIPLYMTSLYSIVDGCNSEIYSLIRGVLMQEMLHMAQVANLLIALGGTPEIDSKDAAPSYPKVGLPGCVLPSLSLTLERASRKHIHDVLMAVEFPHKTEVALTRPDFTNATIGQFYMQMNNCISQLAENGVNLFSDDRISKQVQWPWNNAYGTLYIVHDSASAMNAINEIVEQGEGASPIDPDDEIRDQLAHFYKLEEIVCGFFLNKNETHYSYSGESIQFQEEGVWPMRNNPSKNGIHRGTRAYFEAKAFHQVYRNLLGKLQETFGGEPEKIRDAVALMESLQVHAKRVMALKLDPEREETVGPVFDYLWED